MTPGARTAGPGNVRVHTRFTDRGDGDLFVGLPVDELMQRRASIAPFPWTWLNQVHGNRVVVVRSPGEHAGESADAAVTDICGATLAVHTADCAGVLLRGEGPEHPVIGAAHAGWRGLESGVLEATVAAMRELGAESIRWRLGPCISAERYEFSPVDLDRLSVRLGEGVRSRTTDGAPALDLRAGVARALEASGAEPEGDAEEGREGVGRALPDPPCTATDERFYSWRARGDHGRQAAITWMTEQPEKWQREQP